MLKLRKFLVVASICLGFSFNVLTPSLSAVASESLGIGLTVIPLNDGSDANLTFNNQLWFGIDDGKSLTRRFQVSSASKIDQLISFQLFDVRYEDGLRRINTERPGETTPWVTFSPESAVIKPGGVKEFQMTYSIPADESDGVFESFLRVNATAASLPQTTSNNDGVRVELIGAAAIDTPVWLGIGDAESLKSDFEISRVFGALIGGEKKLRIEIKNSGKTPLGLRGTVQLTDPSFADRSFGPFGYRSAEVPTGKTAIIDVDMPSEVTEGVWEIYVIAEQGNIRKTRLFTEDLKFEPIGNPFPIEYLLIALGLIGLLLGWYLFRQPRSEKKKSVTSSSDVLSAGHSQEYDKLIEELLRSIEIEEFYPPRRSKPEKQPSKATKKTSVKKKANSKPKAKSPPKRVKTATKKATSKRSVKRPLTTPKKGTRANPKKRPKQPA